MSSTPQQYLESQIQTMLTADHPGQDPAATALFASELATIWTSFILPNLTVNLLTGVVTLVVPAGD